MVLGKVLAEGRGMDFTQHVGPLNTQYLIPCVIAGVACAIDMKGLGIVPFRVVKKSLDPPVSQVDGVSLVRESLTGMVEPGTMGKSSVDWAGGWSGTAPPPNATHKIETDPPPHRRLTPAGQVGQRAVRARRPRTRCPQGRRASTGTAATRPGTPPSRTRAPYPRPSQPTPRRYRNGTPPSSARP